MPEVGLLEATMIGVDPRESAYALTLNLRRCGVFCSGAAPWPKKTVKFDPDDGLIVGEVGPWAAEKHDRVEDIFDAARGARAKFLPPKGNGGARYIELYSGAGRSVIKDTNQIIEGSAVVAFNAGRASGHPFSEMHLSDLEAQNSAALAQRITDLGGSRDKLCRRGKCRRRSGHERDQSIWPSPCLS